MKIALLLGSGVSGHYEVGLISGLAKKKLSMDVIGTDEIINSPVMKNKGIQYLQYFDSLTEKDSRLKKIRRIFNFYIRMIKYTIKTDVRLFHLQWHNKFIVFDRIVMNLFYKLAKKKLVYTAHNIDADQRNERKTIFNRISLSIQYRIVDHIIVHTKKMKEQLILEFNINSNKISVIPHGIILIDNKYIDDIPKNIARKAFKLSKEEKVILFFGNITSYKGVEFAVNALHILVNKFKDNQFRLIIAGEVKKENITYYRTLEDIITQYNLDDYIIKIPDYIPDSQIEILFACSDVLVLPYKNIFQTGVLFLSYSFGLPVIASDVGSLKEDIILGETGYIFKPKDSKELAEKIKLYFNSELYKDLKNVRKKIKTTMTQKYSWDSIGIKTFNVYENINT
jgi:glycosyltransferase involved in cell wall biosynthesis